jgi:16S rRNA (guanine(1405)-N(7))-methyltransferase
MSASQVPDDALDAVAAAVLGSRRYRGVAPALVRRLAAEALQRHPGDRSAARKTTQRQLHQLFGAYLPGKPRWHRLLRAIQQATDRPARQDACRRAMSAHASTAERQWILEDYAPMLAQVAGPEDRVLDLACGLGPLAWAFVDHTPAALHCVDVGTEMLSFLGEALAALGLPATVEPVDLAQPAAVAALPEADVAVLLKALPCLRHTLRQPEAQFIENIPAQRFLVSWPTRSLGSRAKGMDQTYRAHALGLAATLGWRATEHELTGELFYVLERS